MKKLKVVILSLFSLVLGTVLCACCNFKDAKASFSQAELTLSANSTQEVDLDDYLSVEGIGKANIDLKFSDSSLFSVNGHKIKALPTAAGQSSFVYAMYRNNSLASMKIVVTSPFEKPKNFNVDANGILLSDDGILTWDAVSTFYANETTPTVAKQYAISGQWLDHDDISATVNTNSYQLPGVGQFNLKIKALANGHLNDSAEAEASVFYGYMPAALNLTFENGVLSWEDDTEGAQYKVEIDGVAFDDFSAEKSKDLKDKFDAFDAKDYEIKVISHDPSGVKFDMKSSSIVVTKLAAPTVSVVDGKLSLSGTDNRADYYINLTNQQNSTQTFEFDENLSGRSGKYTLSVYATAKEDAQGIFYQSKNSEEKQVYKLPKVTIARDGENPIGGNTFNIKVSGQAEVDTTLKFSGIEKEDVSGLGASRNSRDVSLTLEDAKKYTITVRQSANSTDELLVVDSDESDNFEITKLAAFAGAVKHEYAEGKSRFTFAGIDGVENYDIQLIDGTAGEDYVTIAAVNSAENSVVYDFDSKIEDIENTSGDVYKFRIVAKANDGENAILSFITKELTLLSTPTLSQRENTQKRFEWTGNASKYEVKIYKISKEQYTASQEAGVVADASNPQTQTTENNFVDVEEVGYYFITVQAISTSEDVHISSAAPLNILAIVAEKLEISAAVFGYDADHNGGAYYLDITSSETVTAYEFTIQFVVSTKQKLEKRVYLTETFAEETSISFAAKGEDDALYLKSDAVSFTVTQLAAVTTGDFEIDDTCTTLSMNQSVGTTRTVIKRTGVVEQSIDTYTLSSVLESTFDLEFTRHGSDTTSGVDVKSTKTVYIKSAISTITFNRISQPENFRYDTDLKFDETQTGEAAEYVLDILCETATKVQYTISFRIPASDGEVFAVYSGEKIKLDGQVSDFMTTESANTRVLKLSKIIEGLKASELSNIYVQASEFTFSVYAYQNREKDGNYQIASVYAKTAQDESTSLKIEKMKAPVLSYDKATNSLQWNNSSIDGSSYVLYSSVGDPVELQETTEIVSQSYSLDSVGFEAEKVYTYYIVAKNAKYLDSANSNKVNIQKLAPVSSVTLSEGNLTFASANSANLFSKIEYQFDEKGVQTAENNSIEIPESANKLTIQYIGKEDLGDSENNYYLDSQISTWTLQDMSTLATEELAVTFEKNKISWTEFSTLPAVDYAVVFTATSGSFKYSLSAQELTLDETNSQLLASIQNLSAGDVNVKVYAHLNAYSIEAGGTIYFAKLVENVGYNYHAYTNEETIKKYATPQVTDVKFDYSGDYSKAQNPKIVVTFTGEAEYDENADFEIKINGTVKELEVSHEESYSFTISDYERENMSITIQAILKAEQNIFAISSALSQPINIVVAKQLEKLEFVKEEASEYLTRILNIEFDKAQALGGIVLGLSHDAQQIEYKPLDVKMADGVLKESVEEFVKSHLSSGGKITATAFVNNYVDLENRTFILASDPISTGEIDVLKQLVKESDIEENSSGFKITKTEDGAVYVVEIEGMEDQILSAENEYTFVFPDAWNGTQSHDITLTAKKDGTINSQEFTFTFTLTRVAKVENVRFERADNNAIKLVWDANNEAKEYKVFAYFKDEKVAELTVQSAECLLENLLGDNYNGLNLTEDQISSGVQVVFGIVAVPTAEGSNDSQEATISTQIKGLDLTESDIDVDEYGNLYFNSSAKEYIYRFKTVDGTIPEGFDWKIISGNADKIFIDTDELVIEDLFSVEMAIAGDLANTIDSVYVSSDTTRRFNKLEKISSITTSSDGSMKFNLEALQNFVNGTCFYIGANAEGIKNGNVLKIALTLSGVHAYSMDFIDVIESLQDGGIIDENFAGLLYFWVGKDPDYSSQIMDADRKVTSAPTTYEIVYSESDTFEIIKINNDVDDTSTQSPDYVNSYASFIADENILGVYVKIEKINDEENEYKATHLITKEDFSLYKGKSTANITALFEDEASGLSNLDGEFEIQLCLLKTNSDKVELSKWVKLSTFKRIGACRATTVVQGIFQWSAPVVNVDLIEKYIVNLDFFKTTTTGNEFIYTQQLVNNKDLIFDPAKYVAEDDKLYIAVRAVSTDPYVISSQLAYYVTITPMDQDEFKVEKNILYKNRMEEGRKLELEGGSFVIKWDKDDDFLDPFFTLINDDIVTAMVNTTYTAPFTFNLPDLVNFSPYGTENQNKTTFQFRFKKADDATGIYTYFNVDAIDLLSNFVDEIGGVGTLLSRYYNLSTCNDNGSNKTIVTRFFQRVLLGDHGIANAITIFDRYFEGLQKGGYTLEYCILGTSSSLPSQWYKFEREGGQYDNLVYVNEQPDVKILRKQVGDDQTLFATQVVIKKSKIYQWEDGKVVEKEATKYGIKFGLYTMLISAASGSGSLTFSNAILNGHTIPDLGGFIFDIEDFIPGFIPTTGETIKVYECDEKGVETSGGGYLMFYINNNGEDSLVAKFGDNFLSNYSEFDLQVFAVGDDLSVSSKSEYYKMVFLDIMSFSMVDGQFVWKTRANSVTNIYTDQQNLHFEVPSVSEESIFDLPDYDGGIWSLKFVVRGSDTSNVKYVDSQVYYLEKVFKLYAPDVSVDKGNFVIDSTNNNAFLTQTASQDGLYRMKITNNATTLSMTVNRVDPSRPYTYEAGITDLNAQIDPNYTYKATEVRAEKFVFTNIGTTTTFTMEKDASGNQIKLLKNNSAGDLGVALTSNAQDVSAAMLNSVGTLSVKNGVVSWTAVTGTTNIESPATVVPGANESIVYKVRVTQYKQSAVASDAEDKALSTPVTIKEKDFYTINPQFDFANLQENEFAEIADSFFKVRVQALAMTLSTIAGSGVEIVEKDANGKTQYGSGFVLYDQSKMTVLISNGTTIDGITRMNAIEGETIKVEDGKVLWNYKSSIASEDTLKGQVSFVVAYGDNNIVDGKFNIVKLPDEIDENGNYTYSVIFEESKEKDDRHIPSGEQILSIYTNSIAGGKVIKSYARTIQVTKLPKIEDDSIYEIVTSENGNYEELTFKKYFDDLENMENTIEATIGGRKITLSNDNFILYIVDSEDSISANNLESDKCIIVTESDKISMQFVVKKDGENILYSDPSDEFFLQRSAGIEEGRILWDAEEQKFTWEYYNEEIPNPTFYVTVTYSDVTTRIYMIKAQEFTPTIISDDIKISIRVKLNNSSVLSQATPYSGESANFNLFASGSGTQQNPYIIQNEAQFKNIQYRMKKNSELAKFTDASSPTLQRSEEGKFYFKIEATELNLKNGEEDLRVEGVLFKGEFAGVIDGNNCQINYDAKSFTLLSETYTVASRDSKVWPTTQAGVPTDIIYEYGAGLFENISGEIHDLGISATFRGDSSSILVARNVLVGGLAVFNSGTLRNIKVTHFETTMVGSSRIVLAYGGVVAINRESGMIASCSISSDISLNDNDYACLMFFGGICYTNYSGRIEGCTSGDAGQSILVTCARGTTQVQIAGIAVSSLTSASITNCTNNYKISVACSIADSVVYAGGIAVLARGTCTQCQNPSGTPTCSGANPENTHLADMFFTE